MAINIKERIAEMKAAVKDFFNSPAPAPVIPAAPAPPVAPAQLAAKTYVLDNGTEISIMQVGETPAVGDAVTVMGAPLAAGTYTLQDGTVMTLDAAGVITAITLPAPVTTDISSAPAPATPVVVAPVQASAFQMPEKIEDIAKLFGTFASTDERVSNLETMTRALMEYAFGYKIAEQKSNEAIVAYRDSVEGIKAELKLAQEKLAGTEKLFNDVFSLMEEVAKTPTAEPRTVPEPSQAKFGKTKRESIIERIGKARQESAPHA